MAYQFSPNNPFDYDSVAEMILSTIDVKGKPTKVLMDANRVSSQGKPALTWEWLRDECR